MWSQNVRRLLPPSTTGSSASADGQRECDSAYAANETGPGRSQPRRASRGVRANSGASASGANFVRPASAAAAPRAAGAAGERAA